MIKGQKAPRTVTQGLRQRAWWVIRKHGTVTIPQLLNTLADKSQKSAKSNLNHYLTALAHAGILRIEAKRAPGISLTSNGFNRYTLAIDSGRLAPVWRKKAGTVYDPNSGKEYPVARRQEEQS